MKSQPPLHTGGDDGRLNKTQDLPKPTDLPEEGNPFGGCCWAPTDLVIKGGEVGSGREVSVRSMIFSSGAFVNFVSERMKKFARDTLEAAEGAQPGGEVKREEGDSRILGDQVVVTGSERLHRLVNGEKSMMEESAPNMNEEQDEVKVKQVNEENNEGGDIEVNAGILGTVGSEFESLIENFEINMVQFMRRWGMPVEEENITYSVTADAIQGSEGALEREVHLSETGDQEDGHDGTNDGSLDDSDSSNLVGDDVRESESRVVDECREEGAQEESGSGEEEDLLVHVIADDVDLCVVSAGVMCREEALVSVFRTAAEHGEAGGGVIEERGMIVECVVSEEWGDSTLWLRLRERKRARFKREMRVEEGRVDSYMWGDWTRWLRLRGRQRRMKRRK